MPRLFLPDTNTFSSLLRKPSDGLRNRFRQTPSSMICLSVIVEAELRYGVAKRQLEQTAFGKLIQQLISGFEKLSWTSSTASAFAYIRSQSERQGITIATADMMIAAQAKEMDYVLVTNDHALHRLNKWIEVEDWTE